MSARRSLTEQALELLRTKAERLEPARRAVVQPRFAPLVRIGGRWWRREELEPLPPEDSRAP